VTIHDEELEAMASDPNLVTDDQVIRLIQEVLDLKRQRLVLGMKGGGGTMVDRKYLQQLEETLDFYADPESYFAIGFLSDPPCGSFGDDFEDIEGMGFKPGKRARQTLGYEYNVLPTPTSAEEDLKAAESILVVKDTVPSLDKPCLAPSRQPHGHHEIYIHAGPGGKRDPKLGWICCQACGANGPDPDYNPNADGSKDDAQSRDFVIKEIVEDDCE
jgi:hypothetical protein